LLAVEVYFPVSLTPPTRPFDGWCGSFPFWSLLRACVYSLHVSSGIMFNHRSPLRPERFVTQSDGGRRQPHRCGRQGTPEAGLGARVGLARDPRSDLDRAPLASRTARARLSTRLHRGHRPVARAAAGAAARGALRDAARRAGAGRLRPVQRRVHRRARRQAHRLAVLGGPRLQSSDLGALPAHCPMLKRRQPR
jgi:hypothetical protein